MDYFIEEIQHDFLKWNNLSYLQELGKIITLEQSSTDT